MYLKAILPLAIVGTYWLTMRSTVSIRNVGGIGEATTVYYYGFPLAYTQSSLISASESAFFFFPLVFDVFVYSIMLGAVFLGFRQFKLHVPSWITIGAWLFAIGTMGMLTICMILGDVYLMSPWEVVRSTGPTIYFGPPQDR